MNGSTNLTVIYIRIVFSSALTIKEDQFPKRMLCESVKTGTTAEPYDVNQSDKIRNKNSVLTGDGSRNLNQPSLNRKEIVDTNKNLSCVKTELGINLV